MIDVETPQRRWYTAGMMKDQTREKRTEKVSAKIPPSVKARILAIAGLDDRTESYVTLALIERGLAAHARDGQLVEPPVQAKARAGAPSFTVGGTAKKKKAS